MVAASSVGCAVSGGADGDTSDGATKVTQVVIATHDSWAAPKALIKEFETRSGYHVTIVPNGDAGELTNKLVLTQGNPIADAAYGVDNTFASRALDEGVFAKYRSPVVPVGPYDLDGGDDELSPIDWGDVCVNVDDVWFRQHDLAEPTTFDDLLKPAYKNLFVAPGAATSSPGFAFLLATIGTYGEDGWEDYWRKLMANGAKLDSGWTDAYEVDFTGGGGNGSRPIVLSYNSSPPFTIPKGSSTPTTSALLGTCFRQVEYAGVLAGANNPEGAEAFIDFMEGKAFQESMPDSMYVFPVNKRASLPPLWARWATPSPDPVEVPAAEIATKRQAWLTTWSDITS